MSVDSGYYDDDDYEDDDDEKPQRSDSEWAELRRAKKAREKAEKELAAMKRQIAFRDAGIDPNDPRMSYFVKGYDGEADAAAIKAEAVKAGFLQDEARSEPDSEPIDAQARISKAATGAETVDSGLESGLEAAYAEGGTSGMMRFLAEHGVPIASSDV